MYKEISQNKIRTIVLLFSFFVLLGAVAWVISKATNRPGLFFIIGVASLLYSLFSYFAGAKMALAINGAKEIKKSDNPRLWRIVENISITDGLPMPRVYIVDDPAPNAFATGRNYTHASVAATTGILDVMTDTELEGVMAHEMGHVKNYDMRVNTVAFALVGVISIVADVFWHITFWGGDREEGGGNNALIQALAIVAVILAPIAATLLQLAISRRREYLADATGALTTRYPEGLASALEKIAKYGSALRKPNASTAHMFFANPLKGKGFMNLFSTHPPVEERIAKLRDMHL